MGIKFWINKNKRFLELSVLGSTMWVSMTSMIYVTVFLKNNGLATSTIGILISIGAIFSILTQPIWGSLCDGALGIKRTMILTVLLGAVSTALLTIVKNEAAIMIMYIARIISMAPIMMLFDNYIVSECKASDTQLDYGSIRIWGSILFAVVAAILGFITERYGISIAFYTQIAFSALLIWLIVKYVRDSPSDTKAKYKKWFDKNIFSTSFIFILIYIFLVKLTDNSLNSFFPIIFQDAGGSLNMLGLFSSARAIVEVPFFLGTTKLIKKFGSRQMMIIASAFIVLRVLGFMLFEKPEFLFAANLFGAPAYCLFTAGMLHYVHEISPENSKTTAQLIVSALGLSLSRVISSSAGGFILESYGTKTMSVIGLIIIVISFVFIMIQNKVVKSKSTNELAG